VNLTRAGSGNPGATNAYRVLGAGAGVGVLFLDIAKGTAAVVVARAMGMREPVCVAAGAAAVLGHVAGPFSGWKGGKGTATTAGAFLALAPEAVAIAAGIWAVTFALSRIVSASSVLAALALPLSLQLAGAAGGGESVLVAAWCVAALVVLRHRANLARMAGCREPRFKFRRGEGSATGRSSDGRGPGGDSPGAASGDAEM
jgi:glycerol-3-phosphate acyltransferase PlsY